MKSRHIIVDCDIYHECIFVHHFSLYLEKNICMKQLMNIITSQIRKLCNIEYTDIELYCGCVYLDPSSTKTLSHFSVGRNMKVQCHTRDQRGCIPQSIKKGLFSILCTRNYK